MSAWVQPRAIYLPVDARPTGIAEALDRLTYFFLWAFCCSASWGETVPVVAGVLMVNWLGMLAVGFGVLRTAVTGQVRRLCPLHFWMAAWVGWSILSIFWTLDWDSSVTRAGTYLQLLIVVWLVWELAPTSSRVIGLLQAYVLGALIASGITIYHFATGRTAAQLAAAVGKTVWDTERFAITGVNENDLGLILALSLPMVFYLLVSQTGLLTKVLCWVQLGAGFTSIFLTGSRGSLVASTVALLMCPVALSQLPRRQRIVGLLACLGLVAGAACFIPQSLWLRFFDGVSELSQGTLTHRTVIWAAGLEAFRNHALLGVGAGAYAPTVLRVVDVPYVAHNTFLSVLVELGVVGALLFFALLAKIVSSILTLPRLERTLWVTLLLTWCVGVSALTWEYRKPTWMLFGLAAAHVYARRSEAA